MMRIALIAPPFIEVPPRGYGGTELFIGNLACELDKHGHDVTVYANGDSRLPCAVKWRYRDAEWPLDDAVRPHLKNVDHTAWAMRDAADRADIIHLNDIVGVPFTRFIDVPTRPDDPSSARSRAVRAVHEISRRSLRRRSRSGWPGASRCRTCTSCITGFRSSDYTFSERTKEDYVAFLGRMAPCKGPHLAIEAARLAGVRLKLAGEIQPHVSRLLGAPGACRSSTANRSSTSAKPIARRRTRCCRERGRCSSRSSGKSRSAS